MTQCVQAVTGITDANGNVSFTWPSGFSGTPVVALALQTTIPEIYSARIIAVSASGAAVHVGRSPVVAVGAGVSEAMVNASGITVHAIAVGAA